MAIDIPSGLNVPTQEPLDAKRYFKTLAEMADLGDDDYLAFQHYAGMVAICLQNLTHYVWIERPDDYIQPGVLNADYIYPAGAISNGIDYSAKAYNFFRYSDVFAFLNPGLQFRYRIGGYPLMDNTYTNLEGGYTPDDFKIGAGAPIFFKYKLNLFYTEGERVVLTTVQLKHRNGDIIFEVVDDGVLLPAYPGEFESQYFQIFDTNADFDLGETYTLIITSKTQDNLIFSSAELPFKITS